MLKRSMFAVLLLAGCATETPPVAVAPAPATAPAAAAGPATVINTVTINAVVETVSDVAAERSVLLRLQNGSYVTLWPSKLGARNLPQVKPGDKVIATRTRAVAADIARTDSSPAIEAAEGVEMAPTGSLPNGAFGRAVRVRVTVSGINTAKNQVTITGPRGTSTTVDVRDPKMQAFLKTLKNGEQVNITFVEVYTLRVLPPG
jgi:hypothetical protein